MKKSLLYLFMLVCSVSIFMSCSDDDDEVKYPIDTELAGGYVGNLSVNVDGDQMGTTENQKITISQSNKGTNQIALSLKNFTFLVNVGDIEVDPCTVKAIDGGYAFEGQQNLDLVQPLGNCPVSISGTVKGSNINIEIGVKVGALNQNVKATFVGRKLTGSESSEAKITSFIIDDDIVTEQPIINEEEGIVTFKVSDAAVDDDLSGMIPTIVVSSKAKITPASGVAQDFSNGKKVEYTVTAEDGTTKKYSVFIAGSSDYYSFETWKSLYDGAFEEPDGGWATSNTGVWFIKTAYPDVYNGDYPVVKSEDAKDGTVAAKLITLDTNGQAGAELWPGFVTPAIPKVTSGSLFLGTFETDIQNTLNSTKFGNPYYSKPISVHFSYKYTPGTVYYTCPDPVKAETVVEDPNTTDECSATAVIYEVPYWETVDPDDANNKAYDKRLTGANLYTNTDQVIAMATFSSGVQEDYKDITLTLNYTKDYDPTKKYRFAIVFSSSKKGDEFSGAPGSTLIVDNVKVVAEK